MNATAFGIAPLAGVERESFFAAQARHRRSARHWGLAMTVVVVLITFAISLLLAPITFALIGLLLDLFHLVTPTPDLVGSAFDWLDAATDSGSKVPVAEAVEVALLAALPGFLFLLLVWWRLGRIVAKGNHEALHAVLGLRGPCKADLEESQLENVVEEIAIAAGASPPRLLLLDSDSCNLGLLGDGKDSVLVVTRGVLDHLDRAQTQALIAQSIAAIGNGDDRLAMRILHLDLIIGLLSLLARTPVDKAARSALRRILRPTSGDGALAALRCALGASSTGDDAAGDLSNGTSSGSANDWRAFLWMPLAGSLLIGILLIPISVALLVAPLNGLIWRRRRLLADACAVQFARDPQALAEAYAALAKRQTALGIHMRGLGNLFLLDTGSQSNLRLGSPYPSFRARIARLNAMGAAVTLGQPKHKPLWMWLVAVPIGIVVIGLCCVLLVLGTWLSLALNGLFLAIPTAVLHYLLRNLAG